MDTIRVEALSAMFHDIYMAEQARQAAVGLDKARHPTAYADLSEATKEYDRVLARFVLAHCDAFTAANLLAHRAGTCVEREEGCQIPRPEGRGLQLADSTTRVARIDALP